MDTNVGSRRHNAVTELMLGHTEVTSPDLRCYQATTTKNVFSHTVYVHPGKIYQCFGKPSAYISEIEETSYEESVNFY
jgi:hypothetical protein